MHGFFRASCNVRSFRKNIDDDILPVVVFFIDGLKPFFVNLLAVVGDNLRAGVIRSGYHGFYADISRFS